MGGNTGKATSGMDEWIPYEAGSLLSAGLLPVPLISIYYLYKLVQ